MLTIKKEILKKLIGEKSVRLIKRSQLQNMSFAQPQDIKSLAYYILALSQQMDNKNYKNLVQFFLLSLADVSSTNNDNIVAFSYAIKYLPENIDDNYIEKIVLQIKDMHILEFFSSITVKYDDICGERENLLLRGSDNLKNLGRSILGEIKKPTFFENISGIVLKKIAPDYARQATNIFMQYMPEEDLQEHAKEKYLSLYGKKAQVDFFAKVISQWTNSQKASLIREKMEETISFMAQDDNLHNKHHIEDLFKKHIPQLIAYIEPQKKKGQYEKEIALIIGYIDKINIDYSSELEHKKKIYQRYLEGRISDI